jgi:hypothetical protein
MGETSGATWRRPARCGSESACVEVEFTGDQVRVRNSRRPEGPITMFDLDEWAEFVKAVKGSEFDG